MTADEPVAPLTDLLILIIVKKGAKSPAKPVDTATGRGVS
jgi:hypothetical protein